jgi:hypothetical protein
LPDQNNNKTLDLLPGAYADITINTYFFNNWTMQTDTVLSCTSGSGLIIVYVKNGFTFRGTMVEEQQRAAPLPHGRVLRKGHHRRPRQHHHALPLLRSADADVDLTPSVDPISRPDRVKSATWGPI